MQTTCIIYIYILIYIIFVNDFDCNHQFVFYHIFLVLYDAQYDTEDWRVRYVRGKDLMLRNITNLPEEVADEIQYNGLDVPGPLKGQTSHVTYWCKYNQK